MNKIVFLPTNNIGKYNRYKKSFENLGIDYRRYYIKNDTIELKVDVKEDGKNLKENACKKAEALYIDGLSKEEQPGMFVRRFNGLDSKRATDGEVVTRYTEFVNKLGGEAKAKWVYSLVMFDGKKFSDYTWEEEVLFSDTPHFPITKGYVLNNITIIGKSNKGENIMLSDLSEEERFKYLSEYTDSVANFVNKNM